MDSGFLNSLVADYLGSVSSKLAEKFKKETKSSPLPPDSPGIAEMVKHFKETTPKVSKRKLAMTNGDSAAKKAKKDESSSDDSDSDDDNKNKKPAAKAAKAAPVEKMEESSDDSDSEDEKPAAKPAAKPASAKKVAKKESSSEDSSDDEDEKPAAKKATPAKPAPKAAAKKESSSDDSDSDEEEKPAAKPAAAKAAPKAAAKKEESSSDDSSDEEEKPAAKAAPAKPAAKAAAKKEESSSDEDSSDEDEKPAAKAAPVKAAPKAAAKKEESSSDEDSSDEEEEKPAAKKPAVKPAAAKKEESSSDEDSSDDEDEKPAPKAAKAAAKKEESSDSDSSDDSDDEPAPKKAAKPAPAEPMDEDEPAMVVKSNKNKTLDDMKTPTKSHDQSYGGGDKSFSEEGRKIFIHNVSEEATYEDFQAAVEKHGEVTDFFNPGRGFGFITFSTNEEAQACIKAMDNTEIAGRTIQMNIARPKGEKPAPGTGGKRQEAPEGCKLFVHGITQETDNHSLQTAFEAHGTVTDAYNPGKGFAFVTFSKPAEAKKAMEAFEGQEVCGCYVTINVAKPRGGGDTPGRGGRGGRGGGGGGGRREEIEGAKLFVHNVSEETSQEDIWNAFAEHGTVTDAYNPGRGFAFVTFSSAEDAQKAMNALEGQEVCGREIQCNVAKPREQKSDGGGRGGRGGRGGARGGGRGGRGGRGGMSISAGGGGGNNKKISFD